MIILRLRCGLGNQLFEYAFARKILSETNEKKIYLDLLDFDNEPDNRSYALKHFGLPSDTIVLGKMVVKMLRFLCETKEKVVRNVLKEKGSIPNKMRWGIYEGNFEYVDEEIHTLCMLKYIHGVFQNYNYFQNIENEIRSIYSVKTPMREKNKKILEAIEKTNSVCVHIRRGDYISNNRWSKELLVCNENYYQSGMKYIANEVINPQFFVFSNCHEDIVWIKKNYNLPYPVIYVDMNNSDYEDFQLMIACKHFVISNSSYSWWAQYLSSNDDKKVVAPAWWDTSKNVYDGIYMKNWKIIDIVSERKQKDYDSKKYE